LRYLLPSRHRSRDDNVDFAEFVIRSLGSGAQGIEVTRIGFKRNEAPIFLFTRRPVSLSSSSEAAGYMTAELTTPAMSTPVSRISAPAFANATAIARPMPRAAPGTTS
jgi:hypothetical protein